MILLDILKIARVIRRMQWPISNSSKTIELSSTLEFTSRIQVAN